MNHDPYRALYIHIPFCVKRCRYCDFTTRALARDDIRIDEYVEGLVVDVRKKCKEGELGDIETVYLGGGTPSHIGMARLSSLLYALSISCDLTRPDLEFTMEANPESFDERMARDLFALGVNRLSIGVQSFDDDVLGILGRAHDAQRARDAITAAQSRFENVSIDLMCGIPGQSDDSFAASLKEAIGCNVTHVSIYPLTVEEHTPLYRDVMAGIIDDVDEDDQARHMLLARDLLEGAGFIRYEVASYARPGFESMHNTAYWTGIPYLGLGWGAATMTQNEERRMRVQFGEVTDDLTRPEREAEDLMLGMRMACGVSDKRLEDACTFVTEARSAFEELAEEGLVVHRNGRWMPTEKGWLCGNDLYAALLDLA